MRKAVWSTQAPGAAVAILIALALMPDTALAEPAPRPKAARKAPSQQANDRALAERIDRRAAGESQRGAMRFGDTEVRIGGRASFGYSVSGR